MLDKFQFLRRLGIPRSTSTVLSELSKGQIYIRNVEELRIVESAILTGLGYWQKVGVASKCNTNMWQINEVGHVQEMVAILKMEENELFSSIAKVDKIIVMNKR